MFYWLSLQWENHERSWSRHKDYLTSLQHCNPVQEVKKYHNQVLLDLFEDDTNARLLQSKRSLLILTIF
jgi:DNA-binding PucR family transcriptional regulator